MTALRRRVLGLAFVCGVLVAACGSDADDHWLGTDDQSFVPNEFIDD